MMSVATLLPPEVSDTIRTKRWTTAEVDEMLGMGLFEGQRFELIDGELIDKTGQNPQHSWTIRRLNAFLSSVFPDMVLPQLPIEAAARDRRSSRPEPDLAVVREIRPEHSHRHTRGDEILLAIEVSESTLRQDMVRKRDMYLFAGVAEYWVIDLAGRRAIVHRSPGAEAWGEIFEMPESGMIAPPTQPEAAVTVGSLLPPAE